MKLAYPSVFGRSRPRFGEPKYRYSPNAQSTRERVRRLRQASFGVLPRNQFLTRVDYDLAKERYLNLVLKTLAGNRAAS